MNLSLKISLPIILFFVLTVLLIGPFELFFANSEEFWFTELDVVRAVLPTAGIALILLCIIFAILPKKPRRFCQKLLFGIALGFFVQARINISYGSGLLDGSEIRWSDYSTYGLLNTAIWILCLVLPFILSHIIKKQQTFRKMLALAALFLTVIQIPGFVVKIINYEPSKNQNILITKKGMFDIAEKDNIIIFILDGMDETYYQTFLAEKPDYTENLTGFVHYDYTLASGATTNIGLTSMFTGIPYIMSESFSEYKSKVWGGENSLRTLHDAGYDVGVYSEIQLYAEENIPYFSNFSDGGMQVGSRLTFLKKLYKLDMVKFFPHFLKRFVWMDTAEFDEAIEVQNTQAYSLNDPKFFSDFKERGVYLRSTSKSCPCLSSSRRT